MPIVVHTPDPMASELRDLHGRKLDYLRVSLTEDCNFRCTYCLPSEGLSLAEKKDLLETDELVRLVGIFARLGVRRVRLTGGEPLLRRDIVPIVREIASLPGMEEVALTTNGSLLAALAAPLKEAGLGTVNVSLDSLDPGRFRRITERDRLDQVLAGIQKSLAAGLATKINVLALSDLSRDEVLMFCDLASHYPLSVRFLEFMPLCGESWTPRRMLPMEVVRGWVSAFRRLEPLPREHHAAETFSVPGAPGTIGFIASLSEPFCGSCNRLRLTASGEIRPCLFSPVRFDLRSHLRKGCFDEEIERKIRMAAMQKPKERETFSWASAPLEFPRIRVIGG